MNITSQKVLALLKERQPGKAVFRRKFVHQAAVDLGFGVKEYLDLIGPEFKVRKGWYDYTKVLGDVLPAAVVPPAPVPVAAATAPFAMSAGLQSISSGEAFIPEEDPTFVRWGHYSDVLTVIRSRLFYPGFVTGLSGNGKSVMFEQACAQAKREYIRVQISPETDEDDLLGGFRLLNGETVFVKGPVIKAMERGAILCLDELDRGTNKIMCLQGVLEGKPIMLKKTGEIIRPAPGFNVMATGNTKGKGSDDGRFAAATIIDEAFLERFAFTLEQPYPSLSVELKILLKHMTKYGHTDEDFAKKLVTWGEVIRKTFEEEAVDEVISTRRLCHIVQTFAIFQNRMKAISMCISRFDEDTKVAFGDLYTKIDASVSTAANPASGAQPAKQDEEIPF